ncbi:unnamed protein product, partial [marine sediment metagenome]
MLDLKNIPLVVKQLILQFIYNINDIIIENNL